MVKSIESAEQLSDVIEVLCHTAEKCEVPDPDQYRQLLQIFGTSLIVQRSMARMHFDPKTARPDTRKYAEAGTNIMCASLEGELPEAPEEITGQLWDYGQSGQIIDMQTLVDRTASALEIDNVPHVLKSALEQLSYEELFRSIISVEAGKLENVPQLYDGINFSASFIGRYFVDGHDCVILYPPYNVVRAPLSVSFNLFLTKHPNAFQELDEAERSVIEANWKYVKTGKKKPKTQATKAKKKNPEVEVCGEIDTSFRYLQRLDCSKEIKKENLLSMVGDAKLIHNAWSQAHFNQPTLIELRFGGNLVFYKDTVLLCDRNWGGRASEVAKTANLYGNFRSVLPHDANTPTRGFIVGAILKSQNDAMTWSAIAGIIYGITPDNVRPHHLETLEGLEGVSDAQLLIEQKELEISREQIQGINIGMKPKSTKEAEEDPEPTRTISYNNFLLRLPGDQDDPETDRGYFYSVLHGDLAGELRGSMVFQPVLFRKTTVIFEDNEIQVFDGAPTGFQNEYYTLRTLNSEIKLHQVLRMAFVSLSAQGTGHSVGEVLDYFDPETAAENEQQALKELTYEELLGRSVLAQGSIEDRSQGMVYRFVPEMFGPDQFPNQDLIHNTFSNPAYHHRVYYCQDAKIAIVFGPEGFLAIPNTIATDWSVFPGMRLEEIGKKANWGLNMIIAATITDVWGLGIEQLDRVMTGSAKLDEAGNVVNVVEEKDKQPLEVRRTYCESLPEPLFRAPKSEIVASLRSQVEKQPEDSPLDVGLPLDELEGFLDEDGFQYTYLPFYEYRTVLIFTDTEILIYDCYDTQADFIENLDENLHIPGSESTRSGNDRYRARHCIKRMITALWRGIELEDVCDTSRDSFIRHLESEFPELIRVSHAEAIEMAMELQGALVDPIGKEQLKELLTEALSQNGVLEGRSMWHESGAIVIFDEGEIIAINNVPGVVTGPMHVHYPIIDGNGIPGLDQAIPTLFIYSILFERFKIAAETLTGLNPRNRVNELRLEKLGGASGAIEHADQLISDADQVKANKRSTLSYPESFGKKNALMDAQTEEFTCKGRKLIVRVSNKPKRDVVLIFGSESIQLFDGVTPKDQRSFHNLPGIELAGISAQDAQFLADSIIELCDDLPGRDIIRKLNAMLKTGKSQITVTERNSTPASQNFAEMFQNPPGQKKPGELDMDSLISDSISGQIGGPGFGKSDLLSGNTPDISSILHGGKKKKKKR